MGERFPEVDIVIDDGVLFSGVRDEFLYFFSQQGIDGIIGAEDNEVVGFDRRP